MARTKNQKLAAIIDNRSKITDDMVIQIGEHSFTAGELRQMDDETAGESTEELQARLNDIEQREGLLASAQNNTITMIQRLSDQTGIPFDDLVAAAADPTKKLGAKKPAASSPDADPLLDGLDDTQKAVVQRIQSVYGKKVEGLEQALTDTRKALGTALKVNLDQFYEDTFEEKLLPNVPKGADGKPLVKVELKSVMEHAQRNNLMDGRGRLNIRKAFDEITSQARTQRMLAEAEERGAARERDRLAAAQGGRPGASGIHDRPSYLTKPPVDDKGRTKSLEQVLEDARNDSDLWKSALSAAGTA